MDLEFLNDLKRKRFQVPDSELEGVEKELLALKNEREKLFFYNEFRIANGARLKKKRPQILISGSFNPNFPNLHTFPLMKMADVICLASAYEKLPYNSVINCNPSTHFYHILEKFPEGFHPQLFWDNQIEKGHYIPKGIEKAPFPIFASICHMYYYFSIDHTCSLFDRVLPVSKQFCKLLEKKFPGKIVDLPFGLNWGAWDWPIELNDTKEVDVCVTLVPSAPGKGDRRIQLMDKVVAFKKKYGNQYNIVIQYENNLDDYVKLLSQSLITINIAGINGPYNYRTVEALLAGSMIFECDWSNGFYTNRFGELFEDGVHGVGFTLENFEKKLLYYLTHKEETIKIAKQGLKFLQQNYTYEILYGRLFEEAKKVVPEREHLQKGMGYFHSDMVYYYQGERHITKMVSSGAIQIYHEEIFWIKANNMMIYLCIGDPSSLTLFSDFLVTGDRFEDIARLYKKALVEAPQENRWLIEWNFFLISLQFKKRVDFEKMGEILKTATLSPIPETLIFKYSCNEMDNEQFIWQFLHMGEEMYKVIDQPLERTGLLKKYALTLLEKYLYPF